MEIILPIGNFFSGLISFFSNHVIISIFAILFELVFRTTFFDFFFFFLVPIFRGEITNFGDIFRGIISWSLFWAGIVSALFDKTVLLSVFFLAHIAFQLFQLFLYASHLSNESQAHGKYIPVGQLYTPMIIRTVLGSIPYFAVIGILKKII